MEQGKRQILLYQDSYGVAHRGGRRMPPYYRLLLGLLMRMLTVGEERRWRLNRYKMDALGC